MGGIIRWATRDEGASVLNLTSGVCCDHPSAEGSRALSAELFVIPLQDDRYLVYAPLRRAAFVTNATVVNFIAKLNQDQYDRDADPEGSLIELLRQLEIVDAGSEPRPSTS